jgi:DNA-binding MarR family transcriptional regulator
MKAAELFNDTRLLFHTLKQWADTLHDGLDLSISTRAVLELLLLSGAAPVPDMARVRGVSRQHIQQQVDALLEHGLVERQDNPAHKRSPLIALTDKGRALIQSMRADEHNALGRIQVGVSDNAMAEAAQVLSAWRAALQRDIEKRS